MKAALKRSDSPFRGEGMSCSDRWARKLRGGVEAYMALWFGPWDVHKEYPYYLEVIFRTPDGEDHVETIGKIADEFAEVLDRHRQPGAWLQWGEFEKLEA
jgi:hypothetical protein